MSFIMSVENLRQGVNCKVKFPPVCPFLFVWTDWRSPRRSLFFPWEKRDGQHAGDGEEADNYEKKRIANFLLDPAGDKPRKHHTDCHDTSGDCIVRGLVPAFGRVHEIHSKHSKSHAVTELFQRDQRVDQNV